MTAGTAHDQSGGSRNRVIHTMKLAPTHMNMLQRRQACTALVAVVTTIDCRMPHLGGGAQPVAVGGEGEGVDDVAGVQAVQALALCQVPQHRHAVLHANEIMVVRQDAAAADLSARMRVCIL